MEGLQVMKVYNLTHYQQRFNWDCGISCVLMILSSTQREEFLQNFNKICEEEGFGSSTWTIDLCYILKRFRVRHGYFTKTLGVDPSYNEHSYYTEIIGRDEKRIEKRFEEAKMHGLHVEQKTVEFKVIIRHLAKYGPVIVLTNASVLTCEICKHDISEKIGYAGHYVVLCGYDLTSQIIYYRNPEVRDKHVCYCSFNSMDFARKAIGTDEDLIFIF